MIGMSGGVDSSVAALMLKNDGYEVAGVTMILKPADILSPEEVLLLKKEAADAKAVCDALGIPHYTPDFTEEFREKVIKNFSEEYFAGRTPNPCVRCNQNLKFGKMLDFALEMGYDKIATGHYSHIERREDGRYLLKKADSRKDQSYFLYGFTQHQLAHTLLPLNRLEKDEARALAAEYGLPVANKPDSQEICFIRNNDYVSFLETYCGGKSVPGDFVDLQGNVIGKHRGIYNYTIGQRKGLGVTFGEPRYVTAINGINNTVTLGPEGTQYRSTLVAGDLNFIPFDELTEPIKVTAKVRYQAKPSPATVTPLCDGRAEVVFEEAQRSVTPGQAVVFYDGELVIGGGTILT